MFSRTELLIGSESMQILKNSKVAVIGIGGVGSFTAESLARVGIGHLILIDHDIIDVTNINRQIHALTSTVGKSKVEVMKNRIHDINPDSQVTAIEQFYTAESADKLFNDIGDNLNYVVDAIDNISGKISLAYECFNRHIPIVSSMGMAGKLDPTLIEVADIFKTSMDPLAKVIRKELRRLNVSQLKVVYSTEKPRKNFISNENRRAIPGSNSFVPSVAGLILTSVVVNDLITK